MADKKDKEEPAAEPEKKPAAKKEPTPEEAQKAVIATMGFAANLAASMKTIKDAGMSNPDTDNRMKQIIDSVIRQTFAMPPLPAPQPYAAPPQPPAPTTGPPPATMPAAQAQPIPPRAYPGQKPPGQ